MNHNFKKNKQTNKKNSSRAHGVLARCEHLHVSRLCTCKVAVNTNLFSLFTLKKKPTTTTTFEHMNVLFFLQLIYIAFFVAQERRAKLNPFSIFTTRWKNSAQVKSSEGFPWQHRRKQHRIVTQMLQLILDFHSLF